MVELAQHSLDNRFRFGQRPLPVMPQARGPFSGGTTLTPRPSRISMLARVAGCSHIFTFIAGATITGAWVAKNRVVRKSSASPWANFASMLAVAGATTRASVDCASPMCSMEESRSPSSLPGEGHNPVITLWPVREAKVNGVMNFWAASVITTCTSSAWRCKARTNSAALYAAMPPETPTVTFIAMIVRRGWGNDSARNRLVPQRLKPHLSLRHTVHGLKAVPYFRLKASSCTGLKGPGFSPSVNTAKSIGL